MISSYTLKYQKLALIQSIFTEAMSLTYFLRNCLGLRLGNLVRFQDRIRLEATHVDTRPSSWGFQY